MKHGMLNCGLYDAINALQSTVCINQLYNWATSIMCQRELSAVSTQLVLLKRF